MALIARSAVLGVMLAASPALAYPQYIAMGYTNCGTCHYSATGGGLLNSYGHASMTPVVPGLLEVEAIAALREALAKNDVLGVDDAGNNALHWDVGLDMRVLVTRAPTKQLQEPSPVVIPMLAEAGAVVAYGPLLAYGTVTPSYRAGRRGGRTLFSREHWLQYRASDALAVRAGRLVLPFGLRIPDHTQYTREDFFFDKYDQAYAAEVDYVTEDWLIAGAVSMGDPLALPDMSPERGAALSIARNWAASYTAGLSLLGLVSDVHRRAGVSLFGRARLFDHVYVMLELAGQERAAREGNAKQRNVAALLRAGWFPREAIDLYVEGGARGLEDRPAMTRVRYAAGASVQVLPWMELTPVALVEDHPHAGLTVEGALQLHLIY